MPDKTKSLAELWQQNRPDILAILAGAGGGAGIGGLTHYLGPKSEDEKERKNQLYRNLLMGAGLGGVAGFGLNRALGVLPRSKEMSIAEQVWGKARLAGKPAVYGPAAVGVGLAPAVRDALQAKGNPLAKADTAALSAKGIDTLRKRVAELKLDNFDPASGTAINKAMTGSLGDLSGKTLWNSPRLTQRAMDVLRDVSSVSDVDLAKHLRKRNVWPPDVALARDQFHANVLGGANSELAKARVGDGWLRGMTPRMTEAMFGGALKKAPQGANMLKRVGIPALDVARRATVAPLYAAIANPVKYRGLNNLEMLKTERANLPISARMPSYLRGVGPAAGVGAFGLLMEQLSKPVDNYFVDPNSR